MSTPSPLTRPQLAPAVAEWVRDGLLTPAQGDAILARAPAGAEPPSRWLGVLVGLGVVLVVAAVALFISANWQDIRPAVKIAGLLGLLVTAGFAWDTAERRGAGRGWTNGAALAWGVLPLLGLALISQIFHLGGKVTDLFAGWFALIVLLPWLTRGGGALTAFLIAAWLAAVCASFDYFPTRGLAEPRWMADSRAGPLASAAWGVICVGLSHLWSRWDEDALRRGGEFLGALALLGGVYAWGIVTDKENFPPWQAVWAVNFALALWFAWSALRHGRRGAHFNLALFFCGLLIMSVYVRLVGTMTETAWVFLGGGVVFLLVAFLLQALRRRMIAAAATQPTLPADA